MLVCATAAGLVYVFLGVGAVTVGYEVRRQEEIKSQLLDRGRALTYNVARLKAPNNLERRLLAQRILLEAPKKWQTLMISGGPNASKTPNESMPLNPPPFFSKFLVGTAQAETKKS